MYLCEFFSEYFWELLQKLLPELLWVFGVSSEFSPWASPRVPWRVPAEISCSNSQVQRAVYGPLNVITLDFWIPVLCSCDKQALCCLLSPVLSWFAPSYSVLRCLDIKYKVPRSTLPYSATSQSFSLFSSYSAVFYSTLLHAFMFYSSGFCSTYSLSVLIYSFFCSLPYFALFCFHLHILFSTLCCSALPCSVVSYSIHHYSTQFCPAIFFLTLFCFP